MMKNKIASGLCDAGLVITLIGMMGLSSEGQAGFVLAVKITAVQCFSMFPHALPSVLLFRVRSACTDAFPGLR